MAPGDEDYREEGCFDLDVGGEHFCVPRFCPHRGGRLGHGVVNAKRKTIACPLHHSVFSLETGDVLAGPAAGPLAVKKRDVSCK
jgi:protein arginine N-methyltransferase 1